MLVHLSKTSPYVCDVSLGPIEPVNRMATVPSKKVLPFLDIKESFPKQTRTPLRLLAAEEIPLDTSLPPTASTNSREESLQPVWYSEQTIVDENMQQRQSIMDESPSLCEVKTSLMRKSSTFTVDPLNDSEKENDANIITSTQKQSAPPIEESFRTLEHLLGLGSATNNFTMTMTMAPQESPKSNHDTLSLTIVTPTELVNNTTTASLHMSYMPYVPGGSLPSSQNILLMPTIESTTEPSINTTLPGPFSVDNSDADDSSCSSNTTNSPALEAPPSIEQTTPVLNIRPPTSADVAYRALSKRRSSGRISQPVKTTSPLAETLKPTKVTVRSSLPAPTTRVLRSSTRRVSLKVMPEIASNNKRKSSRHKLIEVVTLPEEEEDDHNDNNNDGLEENDGDENQENPSALGITLNLTVDKGTASESPLSAEDADRSGSSSDASPSLIPENMAPVLSQEFSYNTPTLRPSTRRISNVVPTIEEVTEDEQQEQEENEEEEQQDSEQQEQEQEENDEEEQQESEQPEQEENDEEEQQESEQPEQEENEEEEPEAESNRLSVSSMKSNLSILSSNQTRISEAPAIVLQKSLVGSASPSPSGTPVIQIRENDCLTSNLSPRRSMNPLHSSTPSVRTKSLQMVSIRDEEQISTMAPSPMDDESSIEEETIIMIDKEQQVSLPLYVTRDEGIQTSPERRPRPIEISTQTTPIERRFHSFNTQTTPIKQRSFDCQTSPSPVIVRRSFECQTNPSPVVVRHSFECQTSPSPVVSRHSFECQTSPNTTTSRKSNSLKEETSSIEVEIQKTPTHTKSIIQNRRNVRFQFTPSTDARLAAKEKLEEEQMRLKQEIQIENPSVMIVSEDETDDETQKLNKIRKKQMLTKRRKLDELFEDLNESPILHSVTEIKIEDETTKRKKKKRFDDHLDELNESPVLLSATETRSEEEPTKKKKKKKTDEQSDDLNESLPSATEVKVEEDTTKKKKKKKTDEQQEDLNESLPSATEIKIEEETTKKKKKKKSDHHSDELNESPILLSATETRSEEEPSKKKKKKKADEHHEDLNESLPSATEIKIEEEPPKKKKKKKTDEHHEDLNESLHSGTEIKIDDEASKKKRPARVEKKISPTIETENVVLPASVSKKIMSRKRPNPKSSVSNESSPQNGMTNQVESNALSPTEPLLKRAKTSRTVSPSNDLPATRSRAKIPNQRSSSPENKRKLATVKKGKRRLHSAEQDEGLNTADEEENQNNNVQIESTDEQREKLESLTVVELKNRLTAHGQTIPKGVRKADLVALLVNIELETQKQSGSSFDKDQAEPQPPTTRKARRKKTT